MVIKGCFYIVLATRDSRLSPEESEQSAEQHGHGGDEPRACRRGAGLEQDGALRPQRYAYRTILEVGTETMILIVEIYYNKEHYIHLL